MIKNVINSIFEKKDSSSSSSLHICYNKEISWELWLTDWVCLIELIPEH